MYSLEELDLIQKYINGDTEEEQSLELENNVNFMMKVIEYTKDKNMYLFCSDELKNNYEFVLFMINLFDKDLAFISEVADEYLSKRTEKDESCTYDELNIIMNDKYKQKGEHLNKYRFAIEIFFMTNQTIINEEIQKIGPLYSEKKYGMGFVFYENAYSESDVIKRYIAKNYIDKIFFREDNESLESIIHRKFKTFNKLEEIGLTTYLINYISQFDSYLSNYITNNVYLLDDIKRELEKIKNNWKKYNLNLEQKKFELFMEKLRVYTDNPNYCLLVFNTIEILNYIKEELHIEPIIDKYLQTYYFDTDYENYEYDEFDSEYESIIKENMMVKPQLNKDNMNLMELRQLNEIITIAKKIFIDNDLSEDDEYIIKKPTSKKTTILKLIPITKSCKKEGD